MSTLQHLLPAPQVTLTADEDSRYISWRRRRLYLLMSKNRYVARLFSVMLGYDIAEKLYNLNNKLYIKSGMLLDIRLPSLYHVLAPASQGSEGGSASDGGCTREQDAGRQDPVLARQQGGPPPSQGPGRKSTDGCPAPQRWCPDPELPSGEDSTSLVLEDFTEVAGSLTDYGSERDYLR